jgi:hypothetical protein
MSSLVKCDRCGRTGEVKKFKHIRAHTLTEPGRYDSRAVNMVDVCNKCYKEIFKKVNTEE